MAKCFYHSEDYDGILSAVLVNYFHAYNVKLYPINYGDKFPFDEISKEDIVYMVDFTLEPFKDMVKLKSLCKQLIWIDHHISSIRRYNEYTLYNNDFYIDGFRNRNYAACELVWYWFSKHWKMPEIVTLIGKYDVWDKSDIDFWNNTILPFQYGLRLKNLDTNRYIWDKLLFPNSDCLIEEKIKTEILFDGKICLQYLESHNKQYLKEYGYRIEFNGLKAIVCNIGHVSSTFFKSIDDVDIMFTFVKHKGTYDTWKVSLYSDTVDCSIIARAYGGGGHKGAAGFITKDISFLMPK